MVAIPRLRRRRRKAREAVRRGAVGAPPGVLVADPQARPSVFSALGIGEGRSELRTGISLEEALAARKAWPLVWIDCTGLADIEDIQALGAAFGLHPLSLEDVVNTDQRPKCEVFDDLAFVVLRMVHSSEDGGEAESEQLSIFFGEGFVLTFQERPGDAFSPVRERIARGAPRILTGHGDYLAYALIDAVVDAYFPLVDAQTARIETLEDEIFADVDAVQVPELHAMARDMLQQKRWLRPTRDAIGVIMRIDRPWLRAETKTYLRDVQDHADQLIDLNDTDRDTVSGLVDLHMTLSSARTNEVINLLTIVSTIFIPLSFLAGVWGMNFDPAKSRWNMPLTQSPYGYPIALGIMALVAIGLLGYFRRRRWI
ncbi:magnesium/cobalt transporter CorA [Jiella sp. M17.18]|uniref:magnesium/cobalt transporter CorA n=1 Tax=Jiella sp. M17.18 TaxID=3234247 RepID=UPI0034DF5AFC